PFEARLERAKALLGDPPKSKYAKVLEHVVCQGQQHLEQELRRVQAQQGEGLMLRKAGSRYEGARSSTLLKVKTFQDAEAVVVRHEGGKGRHRGRLGALFVRAAGGITFKVGTGFTDRERDNPPAVGTVITYRYQELTKAGVPRFPA